VKEADVRKLLYQTELKRVKAERPDSRIVDELVLLRGLVRVDVAVINDCLHGYEIKSDADNLERLPGQQAGYKKVFERMTLVAAERHIEEAVKLVPPCWGLIAVGEQDGSPYAKEIWPSILNRELDSLALAQLLWRDEVIELLDYFGLTRGLKDKPRKTLWKSLSKSLTTEQIKAFVCYKLKSRKDWRGH
jgi:hypothetical protein